MANYIGMNYNLDCVCYDAWDETTIMAFKDDVIQFFTNEVLTSTQSRLAMFPQIGTSTVSSVYRASVAGTNPNTFWQLYFYDDAGNYWRYETTSLNPTGYTFLATGSHPWMSGVGPRGEGWQLWFKLINGVPHVDVNGNTGNWQPFGSGTSLYPTLPNTQVPDACWHNTATGEVYVSIIDTIYVLDTATTTVTSFAKYNVAPVSNNIFHGVPHYHQASGVFPSDPTITYFFYYDGTINKVYKHDSTSNTTTIHDIGTGANQLFPSLPTTQAMDRAVWDANGKVYVKWEHSPGVYHQRSFTSSTTSPQGAVSTPSDALHNATTANTSFSIGISTTSLSVYLPNNGWALDHLYNQGSWGGTTAYYTGLPQTQHRSMNMIPSNNNQVLVFYDTGIVYTIDLSTQSVISSAPYGATIPPTPLTPIEVVYSAPSQFNLFSNNVALVKENQFGWNFTKTILNADKMELYLYHSSAPGAVAFNYNQLRDIQVNMKNNLALPTGEIFITVWTGPPVAPNWYNYKDIYNMTPPLGTTVDLGLVLTTLNLTDHRTDPILAIALHSNSSQQQVNCDVERVSFDILLPTNNNSQRVIVKLENNFIVVDDKYWNLDQTANGYTANTLTAGPTWEIKLINPNIIAGNYPQSASFSQADSGTAWYLKDTFTNWTTTDNITWTNSGNTTKFVNTTGQPGVASNGAAYPKCNGVVTNTGTWPDQPISWEIDDNNLLAVRYATGGQVKKYSKLSELPTPNNFTPAQIESGCFSSSETGVGINVFISFGPPPATMTSLVFDKPGTMTINSETEMLIRRDWELADTLYSINVAKPNSLTGQYFDPAFPIAYTPDNYVMPSNWSVIAESSFRFEILFSGGLNNSLPAESQNFRQMTVTPTPSNAALTFTWTANYYTEGNILISPVLNITTTGLVSSFISGGSLKPANAAYILYGCTSSENVDAFTSLVFIEPDADPIFNLTFQTANNIITTDGTYTVSVSPSQTLQYDAVFRDLAGASLGAVPGFGTSGTSSSFTITYATLPANVAWIDYQGTDGTTTEQLSITIVPLQQSESFILEFNSLSNQIDIDGSYSVKPSLVDAFTTYAYTAVFRDLAGTSLGAVPGIGTSGISSPFTITFATLPTGVKYIDYNATATGGTQDGSTAQLSITIIEPCAPIPPVPEDDDITLSLSTTGNIEYQQFNPTASLKLLTGDRLPELKMTLVDSYGGTLHSSKPIYYECEIRSSITKE